MRVIDDNRFRPALWLFCSFCVSVICFWYPFFASKYSDDPYYSRKLAGLIVSLTPVWILSSIIASCYYLALCSSAWQRRDVAAWWLFSVGTLLFLGAAGPALDFISTLLLVLITS
jgi:hypothetical protein